MTSSVNSRISPKRYESLLSEIEPDDMNIKSDLYELSIYDHTIHISPGKTIEDEEIKDLVYCYVYVVKNDKVVQKLGVYERFTKEKEEFFDLSTFEKGTLCLFEKYETNPSLFLEFKSDHEVQEKKRKSKKTKTKEPEPEEETKEVDLNAEEAPATEAPAPEPKEVDLNAEEAPEREPEAEPKELDLNATEPEAEPEAETKEVDLNAPEPKTKTPVPSLLDVNELERDLGISESKPKTKIKLKTKSETPKSKAKSPKVKPETQEPKVKPEAETKAETKEPKPEKKPRTKKKLIVEGEAPGTKFG